MTTLPILLLSTKSAWGGAQKYVYDLATHLPRDRFHVTVLAGGKGPLQDRLREAGIMVTGVGTLERDIGFLRELQSFWHIFRAVRKLKPAVVHANGSKGATLGIIAAKIAYPKTKTIWTTHGVPILESRPLWQLILIYFSLLAARPFTNHVIAISSRDRDVLKKYHIAAQKNISLIPIALDGASIPFLSREDARTEIAEKSGKPCEGQVIGCIAEFTPNKGHKYLLAAFANIVAQEKLATLVLIGWGKDESRIRDLIRDQNLEPHVIVLPSTGSDAKLLNAFDIVALTSVKEGLPYTILEAGAASRAVVASRVGGIPDIITNETEGMLVAPTDVGELTHALVSLMRDDAKRKKMGNALYARVTNTFGITSEITETTKVYGEI